MLVSIYLVGVGIFLILARRIPAPPFRKVLRALVRRPYAGTVGDFGPEQGHCFYAPLPSYLLSDLESSSSLVLFEDDRPLGPAHAPHDEMRSLGGGRYSHWGTHLFFTTSDNSDPRSNGRRYTVKEMPRSVLRCARKSGTSGRDN